MAHETIDTVVIGGGQAGIATSEHLTRLGVPHLVLERARIAERWRAERWDSLVANGPAWHDRFPTREFDATGPDGFAPAAEIAAYLEAHAQGFAAPIRTGTAVNRLTRRDDGRFVAETADATIVARHVVVATGPFQNPVIPPLIPAEAGIAQIHSAHYRNPGQLPPGGVLVIGAGSSGVQIADELNRAGRRVWLAVGPHNRPPRRYRGRDFVWWLGVLGKWDETLEQSRARQAGGDHVTIAVSGAHGGHTVDFRALAAQGITLVGRATACRGTTMHFADTLPALIAAGDADYLATLREADAYVAREGLDLPTEPEAHVIAPDPACIRDPLTELDLRAAGIGAVVWATGYGHDYGWLAIDTFDADGAPRHTRGASPVPGLYFVGLPGLTRRASAFIWGVWHDAREIAETIFSRCDA